jgi:hypothetical protein
VVEIANEAAIRLATLDIDRNRRIRANENDIDPTGGLRTRYRNVAFQDDIVTDGRSQ